VAPSGLRKYVSGPSFTARPFGLLTSLGPDIRTPVDPHWKNGVTYEVLCAAGGTTYDECLAVTGTGGAGAIAPPTKSATNALDVRGATSFTVYNRIDCSAVGFWDRASVLTNQALTQAEQYQAERAFWTGVAGGQPVVFPHLAANAQVADEAGILLQTAATTVVSGGVPLDIVEGIGRLESALESCYDGVGVLHVPSVLGAAMASHNLLVREGPRYRTPNGHIVVLGAGYLGTSPAGASSDASAWVYATGAVFVYRGTAEVTPQRATIDRASNAVSTIAERPLLLGWDCCHFAVNVSVGGNVSGTPGA
jgi:hypothetical protein